MWLRVRATAISEDAGDVSGQGKGKGQGQGRVGIGVKR